LRKILYYHVADICPFGKKQQERIPHRKHGIKKSESNNSNYFNPKTLLVVVPEYGVGIILSAGAKQKIKQGNINRK
jgi:hypothetical protein